MYIRIYIYLYTNRHIDMYIYIAYIERIHTRSLCWRPPPPPEASTTLPLCVRPQPPSPFQAESIPTNSQTTPKRNQSNTKWLSEHP